MWQSHWNIRNISEQYNSFQNRSLINVQQVFKRKESRMQFLKQHCIWQDMHWMWGILFRFGHRWITLTKASFVISLICAWTNGWENNRDAGDLRRHRTHYDVTVTNTHSKYMPSTNAEYSALHQHNHYFSLTVPLFVVTAIFGKLTGYMRVCVCPNYYSVETG